MTENRPAKTFADNISQKINGGLLRLESFMSFKLDNVFCNSTFL